MATEQTTVFGDTIEEQFTINTTGRTIRPFKQLVSQILKRRNGAREYRLQLDSDGITVRAVDASHVIAVDTTLHADALDGYYIQDDTQIGVSGGILGTLFKHARYGMSTNDEITIRFDDDFPIFVEFGREDMYSGEIMLAPRVQSE